MTKKERMKRYGMELVGSILIAVGVYNFAVAAKFPMTGFSGISIILYRLFGLPIGVSTVLMNIPLALWCRRLLGKGFLISSLRCMIVSSIFIDVVAPLFPIYEGSRLLAALCTGVIAGLGYALIYLQNSSTGGMDFVIMAVKAKRPYLSLGRIAFVTDMSVVVLGGLLFRDMDGMICGVIVSFLIAAVIDKVMYGINAGKVALIITEQGKRICDVIDECVGRGSTVISAQGGYSGKEKQIVMCACSSREMYRVQTEVKAADPASFVVIMESNEVLGEGFKMVRIGGDTTQGSE
ncbi:MAG: YitT family protein [Clostridiales bacterium]|nr:YitT family protein [Clostridiales bacterium]